jgi:1-deoxy-D-xylulose-5-phosphate reductoisomerase
MKRVSIIGSTGSVGVNTLKVIDSLDSEFQVVGLAARSSATELAAQVARYRPLKVALADESAVGRFHDECARIGASVPEVHIGAAGLRELGAMEESDIVVSAAVGAAGLEPTYAALLAGKKVALANKEAMVIAGELLRSTAESSGGTILPVDSEHNAIDQCLRAGNPGEVRRLILTASGGPFLDRDASDFARITPEEALNHPTWKMGPRITIDSATMMNKGFEVIEARWLFDVSPESIDVVIHPQSIVHSMVEFVDGSTVAQMGVADMRGPIQYALTFPDRFKASIPSLDWGSVPALEFRVPDQDKFPALGLAYQAIQLGGTAPAVLNGADEIAVHAFLEGQISFTDIGDIVRTVLESHSPSPIDSLGAVLEADRWARSAAEEKLGAIAPLTGPSASRSTPRPGLN